MVITTPILATEMLNLRRIMADYSNALEGKPRFWPQGEVDCPVGLVEFGAELRSANEHQSNCDFSDCGSYVSNGTY